MILLLVQLGLYIIFVIKDKENEKFRKNFHFAIYKNKSTTSSIHQNITTRVKSTKSLKSATPMKSAKSLKSTKSTIDCNGYKNLLFLTSNMATFDQELGLRVRIRNTIGNPFWKFKTETKVIFLVQSSTQEDLNQQFQPFIDSEIDLHFDILQTKSGSINKFMVDKFDPTSILPGYKEFHSK